jgi:hypothetical protein
MTLFLCPKGDLLIQVWLYIYIIRSIINTVCWELHTTSRHLKRQYWSIEWRKRLEIPKDNQTRELGDGYYMLSQHIKCNIFTSWLLVTVVHFSTRRGSLLCVVLSGCNTDSLLLGHSGCLAWRVAHSLHVKYLLCRLRVGTLQVLQDICCRNLQSVHAFPVAVKVVSPVDRIILCFSTSGTGIAIPSGEH